TDPYLRFWLRFIQPHLPEIERLRGDLTLARITAGWTAWRGRAIEPLLWVSLARLLPAGGSPAAAALGGYPTRPTTSRSTSWVPTASRSPRSCCSSARSSGWRTPHSTTGTSPPCTGTAPRSLTNRCRWSPCPATASGAPG